MFGRFDTAAHPERTLFVVRQLPSGSYRPAAAFPIRPRVYLRRTQPGQVTPPRSTERGVSARRAGSPQGRLPPVGAWRAAVAWVADRHRLSVTGYRRVLQPCAGTARRRVRVWPSTPPPLHPAGPDSLPRLDRSAANQSRCPAHPRSSWNENGSLTFTSLASAHGALSGGSYHGLRSAPPAVTRRYNGRTLGTRDNER